MKKIAGEEQSGKISGSFFQPSSSFRLYFNFSSCGNNSDNCTALDLNFTSIVAFTGFASLDCSILCWTKARLTRQHRLYLILLAIKTYEKPQYHEAT